MSSSNTANASPPWHAAYPSPKQANPPAIARQDVLELLRSGTKVAGKDCVLVDLRRNDHEGGTIRGSMNLPAQSLYPTIPTIYSVFKAAGIRKVIWYCSSSKGRGTRAAGWLSDYISEQGDGEMSSLVLTGGIKGWVHAGAEYVQYMDEYDEKIWGEASA